MNNSNYVKTLSSNFLTTIKEKSNWGKLQAMEAFEEATPAGLGQFGHLHGHVKQQFTDKVSVKSSWGKNQIEFMFMASVANAALMVLDGQPSA